MLGCRHHFASWFMMRGGNLLALSKILGHAKVSMTEKYAHLAPDHLRSEMTRSYEMREFLYIESASRQS
jgi:site-specific recombinase XerD